MLACIYNVQGDDEESIVYVHTLHGTQLFIHMCVDINSVLMSIIITVILVELVNIDEYAACG